MFNTIMIMSCTRNRGERVAYESYTIRSLDSRMNVTCRSPLQVSSVDGHDSSSVAHHPMSSSHLTPLNMLDMSVDDCANSPYVCTYFRPGLRMILGTTMRISTYNNMPTGIYSRRNLSLIHTLILVSELCKKIKRLPTCRILDKMKFCDVGMTSSSVAREILSEVGIGKVGNSI